MSLLISVINFKPLDNFWKKSTDENDCKEQLHDYHDLHTEGILCCVPMTQA